jgi:hypothetical protein
VLTFDGLVSLKDQTEGLLLIKCWFFTVPFLVYLPLHFQIMLLTGYHFPIAVLATIGIFDRVLPWIHNHCSGSAFFKSLTLERMIRVLPAIFLVTVSLTNLYLLSWRVLDLSRHRYPFYLHNDDVSAMTWLERNTPPDEVVLSSFMIGHYLPGLTGDRSFLGNAVMTMDFYRKREMVKTFFNSRTTDKQRLAILHGHNVRYVFFGPAERVLGDYDPVESPLFKRVFFSKDTYIYAMVSGT